MVSFRHAAILGLAGLLAMAPAVWGQRGRQGNSPAIGYVYPAGGQQGATVQITLGGQYLEGVTNVFVSGAGVRARVVENMQMTGREAGELRERLRELQKQKNKTDQTKKEIASLERKLDNQGVMGRAASRAIAHQIIIEVAMARNAEPGEREIRLETARGLTNPLTFHVGQLTEYAAPPAPVSSRQVLGKEEDSLRRRILHDEVRITLPAIVNGQISSGAVDRYRFAARKGQRLVITAQARQLVPYIADAVPGWFQAVLAVYDAQGKQVAYNDDYRFKPDPVVFFEVPKDGEYVFAIYDAIYRGREDFVYRVTAGELPFVTSMFPLGGRVNTPVTVQMKGWNLPATKLTLPTKEAEPGIYPIGVRKGGFASNRVLFALDTLPECLEKEPNDTPATAQKVKLPIIINGRVDRADDCDVFRFEGRAGDNIVAEVYARRLDSPLDSVLRLTDATGGQLAFNDDRDDKTAGGINAGLNTHHADSYLTATLPADGTYYVHLSDTQGNGGEAYGYRLRISAPQPDFALRVVPASIGLRARETAPLGVYALRKDGFEGDIKLSLKDAPSGFELISRSLSATQEVVQVTLKAPPTATPEPIALTLEGRATIQEREVVHAAVPAEDKMQAFAYHHLVPAQELKIVVFESPASSREAYRRGKGPKR